MKASAAIVVCLLGLCSALPVPPIGNSSKNTEDSTRPFAEDCQQYCSLTYPVHTYPEPSNLKACTTGCRSAQLDAFIAWPLQSDPERCGLACEHIMYTDENQRYACTTGCKTPTIDSAFPNRSHLYVETNMINSTEVEVVFPPIENTLSYLFNSFFSFGDSISFDDLTEHAQNMEMLVVPYLRSDVTILTNDGVYSYREYSFDNGDPILTAVNGDEEDESSSYSFSTVPEESWLDRYRQHRNSGCMWRLHRAALNKMLLVLSGGLIIAALVTCFLSTCSNEEKKKVERKIPPTISSPALKPGPTLSTKKAPYDLGSEYILLEKPVDGHNRQMHQKITML